MDRRLGSLVSWSVVRKRGSSRTTPTERARRTRAGNRRRDTQPEFRVRCLLYAAGLRYRVDARPAPTVRTRADTLYSRRRIVMFIDGCFWPGRSSHGVQRKSTRPIGPKLARTRGRNVQSINDSRARGWTVLRFWEHRSPERVAETAIEPRLLM
ncbi:very short patch repair endonuclease [Microbacterium foliorum]|uniref:very short patch repair endonuclease n=1 Tax=Microbacterium foliorum TaxID=104336 RepID=UPI0037C53B7B